MGQKERNKNFKFLLGAVIGKDNLDYLLFWINHKRRPNLSNPKALNDKLFFLKTNQIDSSFSRYVDKIKVKEYVTEVIGERYVIPTLKVFDGEVTKKDLYCSSPVILKSNHASGHYVILRPSCKPKLDVNTINRWLSEDYFKLSNEKQYSGIIPKLFIEELLTCETGKVLDDFKVHCFNGKPMFIQCDHDRENNHSRSFYDTSWSESNFHWSIYRGKEPVYKKGSKIAKPQKLAEMLKLSEMLSSKFVYVRVDWYTLDDKLFFGELTFNHGNCNERIIPVSMDYKLGDKLKIPV